MNEYAPARGAPPDFNECQYCRKSFATGAARRSHEETSNFCISQQLMQMRDGSNHTYAKKRKQNEPQVEPQDAPQEEPQDMPAADEWEDFGGDDWGQEEQAPQLFEARIDAMVDAVFDEAGEDGNPEGEEGGRNEGGLGETGRDFDSVEELVLAFQTAGRRQKPITKAGQNRILRVLNHPDYNPSQVAEDLPDAEAVTRMLAEMTLATVRILSSYRCGACRGLLVPSPRSLSAFLYNKEKACSQ